VVAVAGDPEDRSVFYFGACAGGVWKTVDGGVYWRCVSDGFFGSAAIGALEASNADPNVIYAGTGETAIRLDVSYGDGVYKSTDAGRTWHHLGLHETRFVGRIRIHPKDPDVVYVAALGDAFGANEERGVFKTTDGGRTWSKILYKSPRTGAIDLVMEYGGKRKPLYAALWLCEQLQIDPKSLGYQGGHPPADKAPLVKAPRTTSTSKAPKTTGISANCFATGTSCWRWLRNFSTLARRWGRGATSSSTCRSTRTSRKKLLDIF
jgi:photosystem II stability/assembly factor-like uncharacterized protein